MKVASPKTLAGTLTSGIGKQMKTRRGFVSNSSSSSFLVAFTRNPKCAKDVQDMVFGNETLFHSPYDQISWTTVEIAERIWNDIKNQIPNNQKSFSGNMYGIAYDRYDEFRIKKDGADDWDYYFDDKGYDGAVAEILDEFMLSNADSFCYHVEYSDNGGGQIGVAMEHGNLFKNLQHLVSSHH